MLTCVLCLFLKPSEVDDQMIETNAVTVAGGYAVCERHIGYATQGNDWYFMLKHAREAEGS